MKLKKSQIFFICYYAVALLTAALAIILFYDHLRVTLFSFFPCLWIVGFLLFAYCDPLRSNIREERFKPFAAFLWKCFVPIPFPFIFFFSTPAKLLIGLLILPGIVIISIYCDFKINQESKQILSQRKQELKKQQEREELGKWK